MNQSHDVLWQSIAGLAQSVLNVPIGVTNTTLGTVNLLHRVGYYHQAQLPMAITLAALLAPVLLDNRSIDLTEQPP